MLQELAIENFAIISSLQVSFGEGMTTLTGETGAGKSIIIDAVGLLMGGRGSTDYIRQGATKCLLEGQFIVGKANKLPLLLEELSIDLTDGTVIISREINQSGKNVCRVNGRLVNTTVLREIGTYLVDIHGQNEHQELMQADHHLNLLDQYASDQLPNLKETYKQIYQSYKKTLKRVKNKQTNEKEFAQRLDMLTFQSQEIESADLRIGEESELKEERQRLANYHKVMAALNNTYDALSGGETSSLDGVGFAMNEMMDIENLATEYSDISETIKNSYYQLQEVANEALRCVDALEVDEGRLDEIETRLDVIRQLKRKYGESEEQILSYWQEINEELLASTQFEQQNEQLEKELATLETALIKAADELSLERKKVARKLEEAILKELAELYLEKTLFEVRFFESDNPIYQESGQDSVEFYITTNPGEPLKPLVKVASGGELSRVMLALKTIFSQLHGMTSIVFDEVDTGVSGRVAQAIANKIHQISQRSQVLCITHLPQVAAVADTQYYIEKNIVGERTETSLYLLTHDERVLEVGRMLAGDEITPLTIEHAKELLALAKK
ncbi:DNA repair protein RecN [Vagococcus intermedius]|uniref:DNA repair protein RecN n=1 Tax=Vagococcus intermedius TaxID=2991418 RepID=A0AAF0CVX0_9ENTE|nr:DNA repair protein RecN [Vagococcus intermedius]WEG73849.1 DNA repair protein RecN [Vagococcus intermedius]WEG75934.1 DNA repair protein RecN [Vagococcus intermedius]